MYRYCPADRPQNKDTLVLILLAYDWSAMVVAVGGVHAHLVGLRWRLVGFKFPELALHPRKREIIINIKTAAVDFSDNIGIIARTLSNYSGPVP